MDNKLLEVKNLQVSIKTYRGEVQAVRDVSFSIEKGEVFCIVGESGCGKSVTAQTLMKLNPSPPTMIKNGEILLNGKDIVPMNKHEMKSIRGREISMIFQDPMTSLNPTQRIGKQIEEAVRVHETVSEQEARQRAISMLEKVGVPGPEERILQYPHEFSGGMRQRVMIAMGLACDPQLLIADEPTTALDVTIQAQILDLMRDLQKKIKTSIIIITHNLGVVANIADRVAVMYGGKLVETGDVEDIFHNPCHEYTKGLLRSIPKAHEKGGELQAIPGTPPDLMEPPVGCPFAARCKETMIVCQKYMPDYTDCGKNHKSACWMLDEMAQEVNSDEK